LHTKKILQRDKNTILYTEKPAALQWYHGQISQTQCHILLQKNIDKIFMLHTFIYATRDEPTCSGWGCSYICISQNIKIMWLNFTEHQ
jgi:hypothetical protein